MTRAWARSAAVLVLIAWTGWPERQVTCLRLGGWCNNGRPIPEDVVYARDANGYAENPFVVVPRSPRLLRSTDRFIEVIPAGDDGSRSRSESEFLYREAGLDVLVNHAISVAEVRALLPW